MKPRESSLRSLDPGLLALMWGHPCWDSGRCHPCLSECESTLLAASGFPGQQFESHCLRSNNFKGGGREQDPREVKGFLTFLLVLFISA